MHEHKWLGSASKTLEPSFLGQHMLTDSQIQRWPSEAQPCLSLLEPDKNTCTCMRCRCWCWCWCWCWGRCGCRCGRGCRCRCWSLLHLSQLPLHGLALLTLHMYTYAWTLHCYLYAFLCKCMMHVWCMCARMHANMYKCLCVRLSVCVFMLM